MAGQPVHEEQVGIIFFKMISMIDIIQDDIDDCHKDQDGQCSTDQDGECTIYLRVKRFFCVREASM